MTTHAENRIIHHQPRQLYDLVADVASYPQFLPWCLAARIRSHDETRMVADLIIGFRLYRERFTSYVTLDPETLQIRVEYAEGPFKYLHNSWQFRPHPEGTEIIFHVEFEFQSRLFQSVVESLFNEAVKRMVRAFEARADAIYGKPQG